MSVQLPVYHFAESPQCGYRRACTHPPVLVVSFGIATHVLVCRCCYEIALALGGVHVVALVCVP